MFSKKKKKPQISAPANFEHRVHTGFDKREGKYVGLPLQWASIVGNNQILKSSNRPLPLVDPSDITPIEINDLKTIVRPHHPGMLLMSREGSMTPQPYQPQQLHQQPTNGLVLPKTSAVARSNSLRSSSPPRIRRDLRGAMANVPPAVPEEPAVGLSPAQLMLNVNHNAQAAAAAAAAMASGGMRPPQMGGGPAVPGKGPMVSKPQPPLPGMVDRNQNPTMAFTNGNGGGGALQMPPQMPQIHVQTDVANNNYLRQQQQVSPGSGILRQSNSSTSPRMNAVNAQQVANNQHLINMQQQQQKQQQQHPPYSTNNNHIHQQQQQQQIMMMMKPNSRASSSSGGNLSTAPSVSGGPAPVMLPQQSGPSPTNTNSNNKQEQRLTHEEFRKALQMVVSAGDPRENLENFMKIGEGSTGTVCIATDRTTGENREEFQENVKNVLSVVHL